MKNHRRPILFAAATALALAASVPVADAGGFGLHVGRDGFGISVAFGNWGVYTANWSDPYWAFDYDTVLAGYGEWVWVDGLGRVWRPWVTVGWQPYTYGRWVSTSYGWTWVAYEPWGYFPHHYGRWALTGFGWVWCPGYTYHAAGVVWVRAGSYVGWYAAPPRGWSHAVHGFRPGYQRGYRDGYDRGYDDGWRDARYATYVPWQHFGSENVSHHRVAHSVASRSRVESLSQPPSAGEVRRHGGGSVVEARLATRSAEVSGRKVTLARPEGMTRSIERHASATVRGTLSPAAITARQPGAPSQQPPSRLGQNSLPRSDVSREQSPNRSSVQVTRRSNAGFSKEVVPRTQARAVPQAHDTSPRKQGERRPAVRSPYQSSRMAGPQGSSEKESRVSPGKARVRVTRPSAEERHGTAATKTSRGRVEAAGKSSSGDPRSGTSARRSSERRNPKPSEETKRHSGSDRSSSRSGARRR